MNGPVSVPNPHSQDVQDVLVRMAINGAPNSQEGAEGDESNTSDPHQNGEVKESMEVNEAETTPPPATVINEKTHLHDQTNLLPMKQLIVVFVGLSCALFCELYLYRCY